MYVLYALAARIDEWMSSERRAENHSPDSAHETHTFGTKPHIRVSYCGSSATNSQQYLSSRCLSILAGHPMKSSMYQTQRKLHIADMHIATRQQTCTCKPWTPARSITTQCYFEVQSMTTVSPTSYN
eukprot:scpid101973/ scgid33818/ 